MSKGIVGWRPIVPRLRPVPTPPPRYVLPTAATGPAECIHDKPAVTSSLIFNTTPTGQVGVATRIL